MSNPVPQPPAPSFQTGRARPPEGSHVAPPALPPIAPPGRQARPTMAAPPPPRPQDVFGPAQVAENVRSADELPVVVVKSEKRPQARLQLGEDGKIYTVTRPKTLMLSDLMEQIPALNALVKRDATDEQRAQALTLLREFVLCVFHPRDHDEVLKTLRENDSDVDALDMADAMKQLMDVWGEQLEAESEARARA